MTHTSEPAAPDINRFQGFHSSVPERGLLRIVFLIRSNSLSRLGRATLTQACAVGLVVLAALPFTAPFAALDIADLLGGHTQNVIITVSEAVASHAHTDDADDVTASDASVQRAHTVALGELVLVTSPVSSDPIPPAATIADSGFASTHDNATSLTVTLRL